MEQQRRDLSISGVNSTSGGFYNHVSVDGISRISGDLDCLDLVINGTIKMKGSLTADQVAINGVSTIEGPVRSSQIQVDGVATFRSDAVIGKLLVNGKSSILGRLEGERIQIGGVLTVDGDVQCEEFVSEGNIEVKGLLNAGLVDIQLHTGSTVQEIGGERIDIRRLERGGFWKGLGFGGSSRLKANVIEGDDVFLEDTEVDTVRGARIYIGRGCKVRLVEYREKLDVDTDAKVGSRKQV